MDKFSFTAAGLEYAAKVTTGSILVFTMGKYGSGTPSGDILQLNDLVNPLGALAISKKTIDGNQVTIQTQFSNVVDNEVIQAFHLKEMGLFAKLQKADGVDDPESPETLVAYAYASGDDHGDYISGTPTSFIINWPFTISNTDNVSINVNLTAYALKSDLDALESKVDAKTHTGILYRNDTPAEQNTIYFVIDEDKPEDAINSVSYDNIIFAPEAPKEPGDNWFKTESTQAASGTKIVMQNGILTVLKEPEDGTTFLSN